MTSKMNSEYFFMRLESTYHAGSASADRVTSVTGYPTVTFLLLEAGPQDGAK